MRNIQNYPHSYLGGLVNNGELMCFSAKSVLYKEMFFVVCFFFFKRYFTILGRTDDYSFFVCVFCSFMLLQSLNKNCHHRTDIPVILYQQSA